MDAVPVPAVNRPGRIALIAGIVAASFGLVMQAFGIFIPRILDVGLAPGYLGLIYGVTNFIHAVISAVALVFGAIGVRRPGLPHAAAGVGLGIGAVGVAAGIFGLVIVPLISLTL
jgi:hypothetical protein